MRTSVCNALTLTILLGVCEPTSAQAPGALKGCLSNNGTLFNVVPEGTITEPCPNDALTVQLGSIGSIETGPSLTSTVQGSKATLDVGPGLAIPPVCPQGQIPIADGDGGWICTPPVLTGSSNPGSRVWLVPRIQRCVEGPAEANGRPAITLCNFQGQQSVIHFVNPGLNSASYSCLYFTRGGALNLDLGQSGTVGSGARGTCLSPSLPNGSTRDTAWALIVASERILPTAWAENLNFYKNNHVLGSQTEVYPIDCSEPEGYEFICQFVNVD